MAITTVNGNVTRALELQPGGDLLLLLTDQSHFVVWDWRRDEPLAWSRALTGVHSACWNPEGTWLALGFKTGQVEIRGLPGGEVVHTLTHPGEIMRWRSVPMAAFWRSAARWSASGMRSMRRFSSTAGSIPGRSIR